MSKKRKNIIGGNFNVVENDRYNQHDDDDDDEDDDEDTDDYGDKEDFDDVVGREGQLAYFGKLTIQEMLVHQETCILQFIS